MWIYTFHIWIHHLLLTILPYIVCSIICSVIFLWIPNLVISTSFYFLVSYSDLQCCYTLALFLWQSYIFGSYLYNGIIIFVDRLLFGNLMCIVFKLYNSKIHLFHSKRLNLINNFYHLINVCIKLYKAQWIAFVLYLTDLN